MGTWAVGSFGNDDAMDWLGDLAELKPDQRPARVLVALETAIDERVGDGYAEADTDCNALAAAEVLATALGRPPAEPPEDLTAVANQLDEPDEDLIQIALNVVQVILGGGELYDLWAETDDFDQWRAEVEHLRGRLV